MGDPEAQEKHDPRVLALKAGLLALWALVTFGFCFFARDLQFMVGGWPFEYWMAAQGALLFFIAIIAFYAAVMKRLSPEDSEPQSPGARDG
jgi:putative solute:sodium symporter small subunit